MHKHKDIKAEGLMQWAARASVATAIVLVIAKLVVWWMSSSVALLGSLVDSSLDFTASLVTFFAIRHALTPADAEHRFGHGKAEALAGLFQAGLMGASSVFLFIESASRVVDTKVPAASNAIIAVSVFSIVATAGLVLFQSYVIKKTASLAVKGDHLHYKGDLLLNLGVILAAFLSVQGFPASDGIIGAVIAIYIAVSAYGIARPAVDELMDREFDLDTRETILNTVLESPGVLGMHNLKTRTSGRQQFIQMHVEVSGDLSVHEGHLIADEIEATLSEQFPGAEILIHIDPPTVGSQDLTLKELGPLDP